MKNGTDLITGLDKDTAIVVAYVRSGGNISETVRRLQSDGIHVGRVGVKAVVDADPESVDTAGKILDQAFGAEAVERLKGFTAADVLLFNEKAIQILFRIYTRLEASGGNGNGTGSNREARLLRIAESIITACDRLTLMVQRFTDGIHPKGSPLVDNSRHSSLNARIGNLPDGDFLKDGEYDEFKRDFSILRKLREGARNLAHVVPVGEESLPGSGL